MHDRDAVATPTSPQGRTVEIPALVWAHVRRHHAMHDALDLVCLAIAKPDLQEPDPHPGRERYWLRAPSRFPFRWVRAVVQFAGDTDTLVTAFGQDNDPAGTGE